MAWRLLMLGVLLFWHTDSLTIQVCVDKSLRGTNRACEWIEETSFHVGDWSADMQQKYATPMYPQVSSFIASSEKESRNELRLVLDCTE